MKKILIAATCVFGFVGVASAQQAPFLFGNYSPDVLNEYNDESTMRGIRDYARANDISVDPVTGRYTRGGDTYTSERAIGVSPSVASDGGLDWKPCLDIVSAQSCPSLRSGR